MRLNGELTSYSFIKLSLKMPILKIEHLPVHRFKCPLYTIK